MKQETCVYDYRIDQPHGTGTIVFILE